MCPTAHNQESEKTTYGRGKIVTNHGSDKGLVCRVYKELSQLKKTTQLKNGKGFEQTFLHGRYTNGQQAHKKMLNIIVIGEMQIIKPIK